MKERENELDNVLSYILGIEEDKDVHIFKEQDVKEIKNVEISANCKINVASTKSNYIMANLTGRLTKLDVDLKFKVHGDTLKIIVEPPRDDIEKEREEISDMLIDLICINAQYPELCCCVYLPEVLYDNVEIKATRENINVSGNIDTNYLEVKNTYGNIDVTTTSKASKIVSLEGNIKYKGIPKEDASILLESVNGYIEANIENVKEFDLGNHSINGYSNVIQENEVR